MAGNSRLLRTLRRSKLPEFCERHQCPYSKGHRYCHRTPAHLWMSFPAHPGMHAGMVDAKGRRWVHYPYEGWKLDTTTDKFLVPSPPRKHRWWCFLSSVLRGRCSH